MTRQSAPGLDPAPPRPRVILLGASNLAGGIATAVDTAQRLWAQPIDVLTALGHGRSYGIQTTVLGRTLPSILDCGLWDALGTPASAAPVAALVTDIGNDLMYGVPVPQTLDWIDTVLQRLTAARAQVTMTLLPLASIYKLSVWRFQVMRNLLFPNCRYTLGQLLPMAKELHDGLQQLGAQYGVRLVENPAQWYGFDPIHIRLRQRPHAWREILAPWREDRRQLPLARRSFGRWAYLRTRTPHQRTLFGIQQRGRQPAGRLPDGTTVSFY